MVCNVHSSGDFDLWPVLFQFVSCCGCNCTLLVTLTVACLVSVCEFA